MTDDANPIRAMESLSHLIYKRHEGDAWFMFDELGDRPGLYASRHADHAALGLWSSKHYEFILYEVKVSRSDVVREMRDPTKAAAVGKYAHKWYLVIPDVKIIADVLVPDVWGILVPTVRGGSRMLTEHRKPKKLKPKPFDVQFCVALIRSFGKGWVSPYKHKELEEKLWRLEHPTFTDEEIRERKDAADVKRELERLKGCVAKFKEMSGVDIETTHEFQAGNIGAAVKFLLDHHHRVDAHGPGRLRGHVGNLVEASARYLSLAEEAARQANELRALLPAGVEHGRQCQQRYTGGRKCGCGAELSEVEKKLGLDERARVGEAEAEVPAPVVANGNDDPGGDRHRGGAGQDVQDARGLLRD